MTLTAVPATIDEQLDLRTMLTAMAARIEQLEHRVHELEAAAATQQQMQMQTAPTKKRKVSSSITSEHIDSSAKMRATAAAAAVSMVDVMSWLGPASILDFLRSGEIHCNLTVVSKPCHGMVRQYLRTCSSLKIAKSCLLTPSFLMRLSVTAPAIRKLTLVGATFQWHLHILAEQLPNLQSLKATPQCSSLDGLQRCTNLTELDLSESRMLSNVKGLNRRMKALTSVNLSYTNVVNIDRSLPPASLKHLDLTCCESLKYLSLGKAQNLQTLRIESCNSLRSLDGQCPLLEELKAGFTYELLSIMEFAFNCPALKVLHVLDRHLPEIRARLEHENPPWPQLRTLAMYVCSDDDDDIGTEDDWAAVPNLLPEGAKFAAW